MHDSKQCVNCRLVRSLEKITTEIEKTCGRLPSKTKENRGCSVSTKSNLPQVFGISIIIERPAGHGNSSRMTPSFCTPN